MKNLILLVILSFILVSCNQFKKENTTNNLEVDNNNKIASKSQLEDGYALMKKNCYICHNPNAKSHDAILAPPLVAIKRRYNMRYSTNDEFTNAIASFVQNPSKEKALMFGAVAQFNIMPKLALDTETLQKIGNYIYENELEQPEWFADHFKEMHGTGRGMNRRN